MTLAALRVVLMLGIEVFRPLRELRVVLHQGMLGPPRPSKTTALSITRSCTIVLSYRTFCTARPSAS
jgi:ABC-type transport system involved in cytochrome bd biosynthesis fused ATPase/permease subunit